MTDATLAFSAFALMSVAAAFWIRAIRRVEVPDNRVLYIVASVAAATLGVIALLGAPGWFGGALASLSVFAAAFFLLTVAIGGQKVGARAIQVGQKIPAFTAVDEQGQAFDSASLNGAPALIKFFRGHW